MIGLFQGMTRQMASGADKLVFDTYDTNRDGIISASEYNKFVFASNINKGNVRKNTGFNLEQFDPQGPINFESNGGFNSKNLNIIA